MTSNSPTEPRPAEGSRLTRRALLLAGGVLAPSALLLGALAYRHTRHSPESRAHAPLPPEVTQRLQRAAEAAEEGLLPLAHAEASAVLASAPGHAPALFILACAALEAGSPADAESAVARLASAAPERVEPRLLERLLAHRRALPMPGWCDAFRAAWTELGRPDFAREHLLTGPGFDTFEPVPDEDDAVWNTASPSVRRVLALTAYSLPPDREEWLLRQVPTLEDPAHFVAAASRLGRSSVSAALQRRAAPVLRLKLAELAQAWPRSMQLQLHHQLVDTSEDAPLAPRELEALAALSTLPSWRVGTGEETFLEARRELKAAGVRRAAERAFSLANQASAGPAHSLLNKRADATRSHLLPGARHPLGRALTQVGTRLAAEPLLVPRMLGLMMLKTGSEDLQDAGALSRADTALDELFAMQGPLRKTALPRWPIASLQEEAWEANARNAEGFLRSFSDAESVRQGLEARPGPDQCVPRSRQPRPDEFAPR
ncbi:MAG TPA: hypothetical protein VE153_29730 [Myxococcus sp.]|nr:hypothetical protein [Myxococcus sp.]